MEKKENRLICQAEYKWRPTESHCETREIEGKKYDFNVFKFEEKIKVMSDKEANKFYVFPSSNPNWYLLLSLKKVENMQEYVNAHFSSFSEEEVEVSSLALPVFSSTEEKIFTNCTVEDSAVKTKEGEYVEEVRETVTLSLGKTTIESFKTTQECDIEVKSAFSLGMVNYDFMADIGYPCLNAITVSESLWKQA